ncbi:MAG: flagellin [Pseudomonadota bacterium]
MAIGINSNIASLHNQNNLNKLQSPLESTFQQLSSGKKVNSAKDDAAGLAIIEQFASQIMGANQGYRNLNDGISMTQVAEGYTSEIADMTQRARELAEQSSNGIMNDSDRAALQAEFSQTQDEVKRLTESANFNGQELLKEDASVSFQVGGDDQIDVKTHDLNSQLSNFFSADISTASGAQNSIKVMDESLKSINTIRAEYGATNNRLESAGENLLNQQVNLEAAKSRIEDTDYAKSTSDLTKNMILNQAGIAMQGYTNFSTNQVMSLLSAS